MSETVEELVELAAQGDASAWKKLIDQNRPRLRRMIQLRIDPRLRNRLDASDIMQEAFVRAFENLAKYLEEPDRSFFVWIRFLAGQQLILAHRHHLKTQKRDASLEIRRLWGGCPSASSKSIVRHLLGHDQSPSALVAAMEEEQLLRTAVETLDADTRELLALRHFEHLSNAEAAEVMGINSSTASTRYLAAVRRLRELLPESFSG